MRNLLELWNWIRMPPTLMLTTPSFLFPWEDTKRVSRKCVERMGSILFRKRQTLELYTKSYATYYWIGQCYEAKGMPKEAVTAYLQAMSGVPEQAASLQ